MILDNKDFEGIAAVIAGGDNIAKLPTECGNRLQVCHTHHANVITSPSGPIPKCSPAISFDVERTLTDDCEVGLHNDKLLEIQTDRW